jgi:hypothetical protein
MQCNFVLYGSHSAKGGFMKKMYLVNKNIVHLVDDIFWNMGFKTETQAEKVIPEIIIILCIMFIIVIMTIYSLCTLFALCVLYVLCILY